MGMYISRRSRIDNCLFVPSDETLQTTRKEVNQSWSRRVTRYKWELSCGVHEILLSPQKNKGPTAQFKFLCTSTDNWQPARRLMVHNCGGSCVTQWDHTSAQVSHTSCQPHTLSYQMTKTKLFLLKMSNMWTFTVVIFHYFSSQRSHVNKSKECLIL